jgi:hypothetical protein
MEKPYQRKGSISNAHVGKTFEDLIKQYFSQQGISLSSPYSLPIGINSKKHMILIWEIRNKRFL